MESFEHRGTVFKEVSSLDEICIVLNMRFKAYKKVFHSTDEIKNSEYTREFLELLTLDRFNGEYEVDKYDYVTHIGNGSPTKHFMAMKGNTLLGSIRIIEDTGQGLPFDIDFERNKTESSVEASRFIGSFNVLPGLIRCTVQETLSKGEDRFYIVSWEKSIDFYKKIGLTLIGSPKKHYRFNENVVPMMMDISGLPGRLEKESGLNKKTIEYFLKG